MMQKTCVSPTGMVHLLDDTEIREWPKTPLVRTACNHVNYFKSFGDEYYHEWQIFNTLEVTCKRCLKVIQKRNGNDLATFSTQQKPRKTKSMSIEDAKKLCRRAWRDATEYSHWFENGIDEWIEKRFKPHSKKIEGEL